MHSKGHTARSRIGLPIPARNHLVLVVMLALAGACRPDDAAVTNPELSPAFGKGTGGTTTTVEVTSVSPAMAPTDTVVDVVVNGKGFERGAAAKWSIGGDTTKVHVLSTTFVNSGQVKARLQVPATAPTGSYDVEVYLRDGKKGVGVEMFLVVPGDQLMDVFFPLADASLGLRSDGLYSDGAGSSAYRHDECGLTGKLFLGNGGGDATMQTDNPKAGNKKCTAYPRKFRLVYNGISDARAGILNLHELENPVSSIPIGTSALRALTLNRSGSGPGCAALRWVVMINGTTPVAGDKVLVTRLDKYTWRVESQPAPANRAYCIDNGQSYNITVRFTVVARNLPY